MKLASITNGLHTGLSTSHERDEAFVISDAGVSFAAPR
jgi:hypothetical protein